MSVADDLRIFISRLRDGPALTSEEEHELNRLVSKPKGGRPRRGPLKEFQDEYGRALAYAIARARGEKDVVALVMAIDSEPIGGSERRIKGGLAWVRKRWGLSTEEFIDVIRGSVERYEKLTTQGLSAFTVPELVFIGAGIAWTKAIESACPAEERAWLFANRVKECMASIGHVADEVLAIINEFERATRPTNATEWAELIDVLAGYFATDEIGAFLGART